MEMPSDHKSFLDRRDFAIPPGDYTPGERALLAKYGRWLEALAGGAIAPLTPTQEQFVRVVRGEAEPTTDFERAWMKVAHHHSAAPEVIRTFRALAEARAEAARLEAEYRAARSAVLAQVRDQLAAVDAEYTDRLRDAAEAAASSEEEVRALLLRVQHSVTLAGIRATYSHGRVTWDSKGIAAYAQTHPELLQFRKVGKPVVTLRFRDALMLPEKPEGSVAPQETVGEGDRG
jgi:uncharacterized protein YifE (UPF0438 family)